MSFKNLLQLPGSLFLGHETYDDLVGLESRNVGKTRDYRNISYYNNGNGLDGKGFEANHGDTYYVGTTNNNNQLYIIGFTASGGSSFGINCKEDPYYYIYGNNTVVAGIIGSKNGNTYNVSSDSWAAYNYYQLWVGWGENRRGPTTTTNHFIGGLRSRNGRIFGEFYGTNMFHGNTCPGGGGEIRNLGSFILPGAKSLTVCGSIKLNNLRAGNLDFSNSYFTNYVLVGESDNSIPSGKCIGGAYTEINGGSLKVTSSGYFEARCDGSATQKIPAGKYAWPLRYKSGTCNLGISTSGGKARTLFGGAAVGRQITNMGRLVVHGTLAASTGKTEDLQSYWMDKGPYGGWYLFDPGYWNYDYNRNEPLCSSGTATVNLNQAADNCTKGLYENDYCDNSNRFSGTGGVSSIVIHSYSTGWINGIDHINGNLTTSIFFSFVVTFST